jgi:hypothetical protein
MEATCSSETWVDTQRTTRRYIPEDGTLHNHRCENLKSYTVMNLRGSMKGEEFLNSLNNCQVPKKVSVGCQTLIMRETGQSRLQASESTNYLNNQMVLTNYF